MEQIIKTKKQSQNQRTSQIKLKCDILYLKHGMNNS